MDEDRQTIFEVRPNWLLVCIYLFFWLVIFLSSALVIMIKGEDYSRNLPDGILGIAFFSLIAFL
ncbi:MAG: hypothetical protein ACYS8W_15570, partial [Planctomycetota bacterium]